MNRFEQFIFKAVNAIASRRLEASAEYLLAETVRAEIANAKRESCAKNKVGLIRDGRL
jgi:hypothetical protein